MAPFHHLTLSRDNVIMSDSTISTMDLVNPTDLESMSQNLTVIDLKISDQDTILQKAENGRKPQNEMPQIICGSARTSEENEQNDGTTNSEEEVENLENGTASSLANLAFKSSSLIKHKYNYLEGKNHVSVSRKKIFDETLILKKLTPFSFAHFFRPMVTDQYRGQKTIRPGFLSPIS